jgi:threonylcarbamoyladenosine tRNA methylthiotransferase MtaB
VLLKAMRRKYLRELYEDRIKTIKSLNQDTCIGVDVIVGFPGETDELFQETFDFIKDLDISYLHVFTYSERANTTAPKLGQTVPMSVRKERSKMLHILSDKKKRAFYESQMGKSFEVLFEKEEEDGMVYGFTPNYVKVKLPNQAQYANSIIKVHLNGIDRDGIMIGTPTQPMKYSFSKIQNKFPFVEFLSHYKKKSFFSLS